MIRIVHVISDLDTGGAEMMLAKLVGAMDCARFSNTVISLTDRRQLGTRSFSTSASIRSWKELMLSSAISITTALPEMPC